jgi:streptogramin lyase
VKVIVAGSRTIHDYEAVCKAINASGFEITELISGTAIGVDLLGEAWAGEHGIPIQRFPVTREDWKRWGLSAGHKRNALMAYHGEALILIWDGKSNGSAGMLDIAKRRGLKIFEVVI